MRLLRYYQLRGYGMENIPIGVLVNEFSVFKGFVLLPTNFLLISL